MTHTDAGALLKLADELKWRSNDLDYDAVDQKIFASTEKFIRQAASQGSAGGEAFTGSDAWDDLVHKDDRTSPDDYPDMCLITADELRDYMDRALPKLTAAGGEGSAVQSWELRFGYTNWENRNSERRVRPISVRYGQSKWHPRDGWLMLAFDLEKNEEREFSMRDMVMVERSDPIPLGAAQASPGVGMIERAAKIAGGGLVCRSCGYVGEITECCERMDFDGASNDQIAAAIRGLSVPSADRA